MTSFQKRFFGEVYSSSSGKLEKYYVYRCTSIVSCVPWFRRSAQDRGTGNPASTGRHGSDDSHKIELNEKRKPGEQVGALQLVCPAAKEIGRIDEGRSSWGCVCVPTRNRRWHCDHETFSMGVAQLQGFGPAEACIPSETTVTEYILLAVHIGAELRQLC